MTKKKLTFWVCDYSEKTGEGNLARKFIENFYKNSKIDVKTLKFSNLFNHKYIIPFIGIFTCWKYYLKGHAIGYINYLPLWNFLIFALLPPKTILGPITGGAFYGKTNLINFFIRKFIFLIFYKLSEFILNIRHKNELLFSTELLKNNLSKKTIKRCKFNFVLDNLKIKKKKIKDIDFLIYYRKHNNKLTFFKYNFLENLIKYQFKILIVGDKLSIKGVKNLGFINKKKISELQSRTKYSLCSGENIYSLFVIECITNHVKILIDKHHMKKIKFFKKFFINIDNFNLNSNQ